MEKIIQLVTVLFILSMIFERINEFLKQYLSCRKVIGLGWYIVGDTTTKFPDGSKEEKRREYRILKMNLFIGFMTSFLAHASFFDLLKHVDDPGSVIGWPNEISLIFTDYNWRTPFHFIVGCLFTGAFISMGSKFWHDLLDLLLYSKNLKEKLSQPETYEVTGADQLTEYLSFSESDLVRLAIAQNEQMLKTKFSNIEFLNDSIAIVNGERRDVLGIYLHDDNINGLPDKVPVKLPSGKMYQVVTEIIPGIGVASITAGMDGSVSNIDLFGFTGSACCIVTDENKKNYFLTNCHVLTGGDLKNPLFKTGDQAVLYEDKKIGSWYFGSMDTSGDFALAEITDVDLFYKKYTPEKFGSNTREIVKDDWLKEKVTVRGNKCKTVTEAFVIEVVQKQLEVKYKNNKSLIFDKAILIGSTPDKKRSRSVSNLGDSGGAVFDKEMNLIGIITAKGNNYSYVIPIADFLNKYKLKIKQQP